MKEILRQKAYKATNARLAILDIFSKNNMPLDAETIYKKLKKLVIGKNINEATVYRTLSSFVEKDILKRVDLRKDSIFFELKDRHHHHLVCIKCNDIEDFKNEKLENLLGRIVEQSSKFKSIKDHSLELFGLCVKCI